MTRPLVIKFGGELIEHPAHLAAVVAGLSAIAATGVPLVVVHGGGKEIDAALKTAGIEKRQVEGLRITDQATLDMVVSVLAGAVNTRLVAALNSAGVRAVGLTGADAIVRPVFDCAAAPDGGRENRRSRLRRYSAGRRRYACAAYADRRRVRAGRSRPSASTRDGRLLNVNADTFAGHVAARLGARRLVIAGTTAGVLDADGATLAVLDGEAIARLVDDGTATAGMIAKLRACEHALGGGVGEVVIVDGRDGEALEGAATSAAPASRRRGW